MPVALSCACGRSLRVKDEAAGKKVRCPQCATILSVPKPEPIQDAEAEALALLLEDNDEPTPYSLREAAKDEPRTDAIQPARPGPRPQPPPEPPRPEWKWKKKKTDVTAPSIRKPRKGSGGLFNNVNPNYGVMWTGILMVLGSLALLLVNVAIFFAGWIVFKLVAVTAVLFFAGLGTFFKGLMGRTD